MVAVVAGRCSLEPVAFPVVGELRVAADCDKAVVVVESRPGAAGIPCSIPNPLNLLRVLRASAVNCFSRNQEHENQAEDEQDLK